MNLLTEEMQGFLGSHEFIYLATCDSAGRPYVVPKFLISVDANGIYLADFAFGRTFENLRAWPRASFSVMEMNSITGYQMNGSARVFQEGEEYAKVSDVLGKRKMHFCVERIVRGMKDGKKSIGYEAAFPDHFAVIRVDVEEVVEITLEGRVNKKHRNTTGKA